MNLADYSSQRASFPKIRRYLSETAPAACFLTAQKVFWMSCMFFGDTVGNRCNPVNIE